MRVRTGKTAPGYAEFLSRKDVAFAGSGIDASADALSPALYPFQRHIVAWALRKARAAVFADCGMGKTLVQLEWSHQLLATGRASAVLILTPLAVAEQTCAEAQRFGIEDVRLATGDADVRGRGIYVTNYEKLHHFDREVFQAIVLDESSILKAFDGKTRRYLTHFAARMPYRLACTATPAPNDLIELSNHAEFLGVLTGREMLALFFRQDGNTTHAWRLKGHAERDFWRWLSSWAIAARHPRDLGFEQDGYDLPPLIWSEMHLEGWQLPGQLFPVEVVGLNERRLARRETVTDRVAAVVELIAQSPEEQWLLWCDLNVESEALVEAIEDAVEVRGSDSETHKREALLGFAAGTVRRLVTKPSIAGHGMNWQRCRRMAFVGLGDSYEALYQSVRRCWRYGQSEPVHAHVITTTAEGSVIANIQRKQAAAERMIGELVRHIGQERGQRSVETLRETASGDSWTMILGDSIEEVATLDPDSIGLSVFSPPFPGMYAYTDSARDLGNCRSTAELVEHFSHLIPGLLRVTMPGRMCCVHLAQEPVFKRDAGAVGLRDFRGAVIEAMIAGGWIYYSEVTIDKNPQVKAARTKEATLLFKTLATDSAGSRPALADYLLIFKKPGENLSPIRSGRHPRYNPRDGWITPEEWIEWAAPVWYRATPEYPGGIRETDVLNTSEAKEDEDQKHLCPLQLGVIERAVKLWSNPGDTVLSPFAGIGSEGFQAIRFGRGFVGVELKRSYWQTACRNLKRAESVREQGVLFATSEAAEAGA